MNRIIFLFLLLPLSVFPVSGKNDDSPASVSDSSSTLRELEQEILVLRRKELTTETQIERLRIDIQAIEKKWQTARETDAESRLLIDSISVSGPPLRTRVLWEQLSAYKIDLENATLLLKCYKKSPF